MLHDLAFGRLENEFRNLQPVKDDIVICMRENTIMVMRDKKTDALTLPTLAQVASWAEAGKWESWNEEPYQYVVRMQDVNYFIWMGEAGDAADKRFAYESVRGLRQKESKHICFALMTAWHLFVWYRNNRFCGRCGEKPSMMSGSA